MVTFEVGSQQARARGKGGGGRRAPTRRADAPTRRRADVPLTTCHAPQAGQFDDADGVSQSDLFDSLIDETMASANGVLVFDYTPTEGETRAFKRTGLSTEPRETEELLGYGMLKTALGDEKAALAPDSVHEAWAVAAGNPYISHAQRVAMIKHMDREFRRIGYGKRNLLEIALTPPS